jgi:RNA recognition motif-containing protein
MNICVRNLSIETSLSELLRCFESFGRVTDITINTYKIEGESRALGFIDMPLNEHARAAITDLDGKELDGKTLAVQME